jgi:glycosyltransferase involved in cell wall biosynthesis
MPNFLPMPKVILISQFPLPFSKIGSWTTLYKNYIDCDSNQIDFIVCEQPYEMFDRVKYSFVKYNFIAKLYRKFTKKRYVAYLKALNKIISKDEKYVIQIVDNFYIVKHVVDFLNKNKLRANCYIQFFYHGHPPFLDNLNGEFFFESINEMVLLTHQSYLAHKNYYKSFPCKVSILHNGIDNNLFFKLIENNRDLLKKEFKVSDKKVFVWCSQDRPKKGLHIILEAWKKVFPKYQNIELWIIGCERKSAHEGVTFLGKIPNKDIAEYLQIADCYLFTSLCQEGFPMGLTEALHCGNYCIASAVGGVPEVLQYGKLGKLIENPHFVSEWENAILGFLENPEPKLAIPPDLYTSESWTLGMNSLINNAKKAVSV